jgi:hypothetical protein
MYENHGVYLCFHQHLFKIQEFVQNDNSKSRNLSKNSSRMQSRVLTKIKKLQRRTWKHSKSNIVYVFSEKYIKIQEFHQFFLQKIVKNPGVCSKMMTQNPEISVQKKWSRMFFILILELMIFSSLLLYSVGIEVRTEPTHHILCAWSYHESTQATIATCLIL